MGPLCAADASMGVDERHMGGARPSQKVCVASQSVLSANPLAAYEHTCDMCVSRVTEAYACSIGSELLESMIPNSNEGLNFSQGSDKPFVQAKTRVLAAGDGTVAS